MAKTYEAIATQTLASNQASVTFNSFSGYTDLVLISNFKNTGGAGNYKIQFNSDTGSNYSWTNLYGNGSSASSGRNTSQTALIIGQADSAQFMLNILNLQNYSNATTYKTTLSRSNDTAGTYASTGAIVGLWRSTSAITSFTLFSDSNFAAGSTFTLYGIKAA